MNKNLKRVNLWVRDDILKRWDHIANHMGLERTALIHVAMSEYEDHKNHVIKALENQLIKKNIEPLVVPKKKKKDQPSKSEKKPKKIEKKPQKLNKVDKRKLKLEFKECPICHESFECRGMGSHLRKCSKENNKKDTVPVKISQEKLERLRLNNRYDSVGRYGRDDIDIPSQILGKGNNGN